MHSLLSCDCCIALVCLLGGDNSTSFIAQIGVDEGVNVARQVAVSVACLLIGVGVLSLECRPITENPCLDDR